MTELLPCPFCGGEAEIRGDSVLFVQCAKCGTRYGDRYHATEAEAIAAWNTRATTTIGKVQVEIEPVLHGILTAEQVREAIFNGSSYASYDGVRYYADGIGMQAIADELNSRSERTCRNIRSWDNHDFECSSCGYELYPEDGTYESDGTMNYCPNCGCKVVGE